MNKLQPETTWKNGFVFANNQTRLALAFSLPLAGATQIAYSEGDGSVLMTVGANPQAAGRCRERASGAAARVIYYYRARDRAFKATSVISRTGRNACPAGTRSSGET